MQNKSIYKINQISAILALILLIIWPLSMILIKGVMPNEVYSFTENIAQLFQSSNLKILFNSIVLGISVVIGATILALPLAFIMTKTSLNRYKWLDLLIMIPFMTPPYIGAMGWMLTMQRNGLVEQIEPQAKVITPYFFSFFGMVLIMSCHLAPFLYTIIKNALLNIQGSQEDAALIYGGSWLYRFRKIVRPLFQTGYSLGALLVFVKTIGEFGTPVTMGNRIGFFVLTSEIHRSVSIWPIDFNRASTLALLLLTTSMTVWAIQQWFESQTRVIQSKGKGNNIKITSRSKKDIIYGLIVSFILFISIIMPFASVVINAFIKQLSKGLTPANFTLEHFVNVLSGDGAIALFNSFWIASLAATIASIIGLWFVMVSIKRDKLGKFIDFASLLPNTVPGIIVVVGIILFWNHPNQPLKLYNTIFILVLTYIILYIPYAVQNIKNVFSNVSQSLIDAAMISGSNGFHLFRTITLPLLWPGIISGWILIFCISMRELVGSLMLRPPNTDTSATYIYRQFEQGSSSEGMAMAIISVGITTSVLLILQHLQQRKPKRRES